MSIAFIDLKAQQARIRDKVEAGFRMVLDHGAYIMGPEVKELEQKLANFTGTKYCVTVSSGTDALLISLMSLGIKPGDEIITTPFSFISTSLASGYFCEIPLFLFLSDFFCIQVLPFFFF